MKKDENGTGEDDEDVTSDDEEVEAEDEEYDLPYGEEDEDEIDGEGNIHWAHYICRSSNPLFAPDYFTDNDDEVEGEEADDDEDDA